MSNGVKHRTAQSSSLSRGVKRCRTDVTDTKVDDGLLKDEIGTDGSKYSLFNASFAGQWQHTMETCVTKVCSIRFCQVRPFDAERSFTSEATGFVVDAKRGYILTNRHVACAGPFVGYAVFDNHEECDVFPIYRDPVHDFGILKFDPTAVQYIDLQDVELRPDLADVGVEIRVVGNDAGEKLSILAGFISRLDRNAPLYGDLTYNDFNTNYIQAAASTSGGSSGSPVINVHGQAVALQAGGHHDAAVDFFLPLDRPLRALRCIQNNEPVSRGTIQTKWLIKPFDECRRLGLDTATEAMMRNKFPKETGLLVVNSVLRSGPAYKSLEEGDVLIRVDGELLTKFIRLDEIMDDLVRGMLTFEIQRGGKAKTFQLIVQNLHDITPDRYVEVCGASFHNLSYQLAMNYAIPVEGVYVADCSGSFYIEDSSSAGWLVEGINNRNISSLDEFVNVAKSLEDCGRAVCQFRNLLDPHSVSTVVIHIDRHWATSFRVAIRNDIKGIWEFSDMKDTPVTFQPKPQKAQFPNMSKSSFPEASNLLKSFVRVAVYRPIKLDSIPGSRRIEYGVVVDADKGIILVSKSLVPHYLAEISLTFASSIVVPGKIVYVHPVQNVAFISYDPSLVLAPVQTARLGTSELRQGTSVYFMGFNHNLEANMCQTSIVDNFTCTIPAWPSRARDRGLNFEAVTVESSLAEDCGSGLLADENGDMQAVWLTFLGEPSGHEPSKDMTYFLGLPNWEWIDVLDMLKKGENPNLRMLNAELYSIPMSQARLMGVNDSWVEKVEAVEWDRHQMLLVRKVFADSPPGLKEGDILLSVNGRLVTRVKDLQVQYFSESLELRLVRECSEISIKIDTMDPQKLLTDQALIWCGATLQAPHFAVRQQIRKVHSEVYVSARWRGSPADAYDVGPGNFITHVNGAPTKNLATFLKITGAIPDNTYLRLRVVNFEGVPNVLSLKKNEHYFPTVLVQKDQNSKHGWTATTYMHNETAPSRLDGNYIC